MSGRMMENDNWLSSVIIDEYFGVFRIRNASLLLESYTISWSMCIVNKIDYGTLIHRDTNLNKNKLHGFETGHWWHRR